MASGKISKSQFYRNYGSIVVSDQVNFQEVLFTNNNVTRSGCVEVVLNGDATFENCFFGNNTGGMVSLSCAT